LHCTVIETGKSEKRACNINAIEDCIAYRTFAIVIFARRLGGQTMKPLLLLLLRGYQVALSPFLGQNCRFYPSCSEYAVEAIKEHGSLKGSLLSMTRLCKCHPWHSGGLDPVPKKTSEASATCHCSRS